MPHGKGDIAHNDHPTALSYSGSWMDKKHHAITTQSPQYHHHNAIQWICYSPFGAIEVQL